MHSRMYVSVSQRSFTSIGYVALALKAQPLSPSIRQNTSDDAKHQWAKCCDKHVECDE